MRSTHAKAQFYAKNKHVLSEVTAAVSLEECRQLLGAVQASDTTYMPAENYCCLQPNVLIREMTRQGLFGTPYFGEGEYLHEVRNLHREADGRTTSFAGAPAVLK